MAIVSYRELREIPLFAQLHRDDLRAVAELVRRESYAAGEIICRQGEMGETAYFVESGQLRVLHIDAEGLEHEVSRLNPGDYFGETSLLLGEPRDATVEAVEDSTLLYLHKDEFDALLEEEPQILDNLQVRPEVAKKLEAPAFVWLREDETVVESLHKHDILLVSQLFLPALIVVFLGGGAGYLILGLGAGPWIILVPLLLVILPILVYAWYLVSDHFNDSYIVTNQRVVHDERLPFPFGRVTRTEAPLRAIQDIQLTREGPAAQVYDFGNLIIETAGERQQVIFLQIPEPTRVRESIFHQIERTRAWARAEERVSIREALQRQFGEGESLAEEPEPQPTKPEAQEPERGQVRPEWWRLLSGIFPALRHEEGDAITWRKHWVALIGPIWLPTVLILAVTLFATLLLMINPEGSVGVLLGYGIVMIGLLPWWIWEFDDWRNDVYQVTATRIIDIERRPFFFQMERREASLDNIQNTNLTIPGFWGRILNYGSVTIETAGMEPFTFDYVKDPRSVQSEIVRHVEAFETRRREREARRREAELLDWFTVYDQMHTKEDEEALSASDLEQQQEI